MSIIKCKEILDSDVSLVEQLQQSVTDENQSNQILKCEHLLLRLTKRIEKLRNRLTGSFLLEQKLAKMKERNLDRSDGI